MKFKTKEERDKFIFDYEYIVKAVIKKTPWLRENNSEDLYQTGLEILIKCVDRYEVIENGAKFSNYAYEIIRSCLLQYFFDYRNRDSVYLRDSHTKEIFKVIGFEDFTKNTGDFEETAFLENNVNIEKQIERKDFIEDFFKVVFTPRKALHPRAKEILYLYFIKDWKQTEIAEKLNLTRQGVNFIIDYHRKRALKILEEKWGKNIILKN